jgi:protein-S-isoprenylcysteine O-methyltransferase Ste14
MESPAVLAFIAIFSLGSHRAELVPLVLLAIWQFHYVYRAFIFPFRVRSSRRMPLSIAVLGAAYNLLNAYVNARWISEFGVYPREWLADPRFVVGLGIFGLGWLLNQHADHVLLHLRKPGQEGYVIPRGGLYRWVSCPNYLGEMLEWLGWACLCWSFAGLSFFVFTTANLFPRALAHHAWYREKFEDYPRERKAILPGIC